MNKVKGFLSLIYHKCFNKHKLVKIYIDINLYSFNDRFYSKEIEFKYI